MQFNRWCIPIFQRAWYFQDIFECWFRIQPLRISLVRHLRELWLSMSDLSRLQYSLVPVVFHWWKLTLIHYQLFVSFCHLIHFPIKIKINLKIIWVRIMYHYPHNFTYIRGRNNFHIKYEHLCGLYTQYTMSTNSWHFQ